MRIILEAGTGASGTPRSVLVSGQKIVDQTRQHSKERRRNEGGDDG